MNNILSEKKRRHTDDELIADFKETEIDQKYYPLFLRLYNHYYECEYKENKDYDDDEFDENEFLRTSAFSTARYILKDEYIPYMEMGHSEEWASKMREVYAEDCFCMFHAYEEIKKTNPQLAKEEVLNYCKYIKADEHFIRYFLPLFEDENMHDNAITVAHNYSEIYKEQVKNGKSEAYAHRFAELKGLELYKESYCVKHALAYEKLGPEDYWKIEYEIEVDPENIDDLEADIEMKTIANNTWGDLFPNGDEDDSITDYLTKE